MSENLPVDLKPLAALSASQGQLPDAYYPAAEEEVASFDIRRYIAAIMRYKWLVIGVTTLGAAGGYVAGKFLKPTFVAQASIWIEPSTNPQMGGPIQERRLLQNANWMDLLRSFAVLDTVVREQRLYLTTQAGDDSLTKQIELKERYFSGRYTLKVDETGRTFTLSHKMLGEVQRGVPGDSIGPAQGFRWAPAASRLPAGTNLEFTVMVPRQASLALNASLVTRLPDRDGNFMRLQMNGDNAVQVALTLNSLTEHFIRVAADLKRAKLTEQTRILNQQLDAAQHEVGRAEQALESFKVRTITLPSEASAPVVSGLQITQQSAMTRYFEMRTQADQLRRDRLAVEAVMTLPDTAISSVQIDGIESARTNTVLTAALADLNTKVTELRALLTRFTDSNQTVVRKREEIRQLRQQTLPSLLQAMVTEIRSREAALDTRLAAASSDLRGIPERAIQEARLQRDVTIASQLYINLQQRFSEARLAEVSAVADVRIHDRAVTPDQPTKNMAPMALAGGVAAAFGFAIVLALLLDRFDRRLRYPDQVTKDMGLTILGALPRVKSNGAGLKGDDAAQVVESLRSIRLNVVNAYGSAGPLITTVTSPGSGDGKSFLASNLALAFADAGHRTLLIDADIRRGTLHRVLNARRKPGLIDCLSGQVSLDQVVQNTRIPLVDFIGCGMRKMGGPELLASPAMSQMLISLRSQYSVIILDSAPLGAGVDPLVLGSLTGSILLVLRTGVTDRELASAKLGDLDRLPIRVLGAVLNDVKAEGIYRYYSYLPGYSSDDEAGAEDVGASNVPVVKG